VSAARTGRWAIVEPFQATARRLWRGVNPELRRSRFHTQKGDLAFRSPRDLIDSAAAVASGLAWRTTGWRPVVPWITFPAIRFLRSVLTPKSRVFEWGAGMSTIWFERVCGEVHSVEDDPGWYAWVRRRADTACVYLLSGTQYVARIRDFPVGYFDLVSIDGSFRLACFREALDHVGPAGMVLVDNTDADRTTLGELFLVDQMVNGLGSGWEVHRFPGWGPCNLFAWETTVCVRRRS
jgi:hypothetical protein